MLHRAPIHEVSILSPSVEPAETLAQVVWIGEPEAPKLSPAVRTSDRAATGEVVRDYRPRDARELAYAEDARSRGTIVRFGSGQVLGVR